MIGVSRYRMAVAAAAVLKISLASVVLLSFCWTDRSAGVWECFCISQYQQPVRSPSRQSSCVREHVAGFAAIRTEWLGHR